MNSAFNEQPTRKITEEFIENAIHSAASAYGVINNRTLDYAQTDFIASFV